MAIGRSGGSGGDNRYPGDRGHDPKHWRGVAWEHLLDLAWDTLLKIDPGSAAKLISE